MKVAVRLGMAALALLLLGGGGFAGLRYFHGSERGKLPAPQARVEAPAPDRHREEDAKPRSESEPAQSASAPMQPKPAPAAPAASMPPPLRDAGQERLVRLYEGMRPKAAAAVMGQLDPGLSVAILLGMRERQAAKILGELPPKKAAELITRMGQPKPAPGPDPAVQQPRAEGKS
jgi:hypothetical protein